MGGFVSYTPLSVCRQSWNGLMGSFLWIVLKDGSMTEHNLSGYAAWEYVSSRWLST